MAIFEVELGGKVIKAFEADSFIRNGESFQFLDRDNNLVGSIVTSPGMSVTKAGHGVPGQQDHRIL